MATIIDPPNSVWPNGLKVDSEGYVTFYPLGTNKVDISAITWPDGDKLVSPFVYQNDKLVGFVDTKALTVSGSATTTMNYSHIEADFASISEGKLTVNAPNATVKKFRWSVVESGDDNVIVTVKYKGCKTVGDVKAVDPDYLTNDIVDGVWSEGLGDLENSTSMFADCSALTSFSSDLSSLTNSYKMFHSCDITSFTSDLSSLTSGKYMFDFCTALTSFNCGNLSSLTDGSYMFYYCKKLTSFSSDLPSLTNGESMFEDCENLTSFNCGNLSNLTNGWGMFNGCSKLTSFNYDLSNLTNGWNMFYGCTSLTSFNSDLSNLTNGKKMFYGCKLDAPSIKNIIDTINTYSGDLTLGMGCNNTTEDRDIFAQEVGYTDMTALLAALQTKGWTVTAQYKGRPTTTYGLRRPSEETLPVFVKLEEVEETEKHVDYTSEDGSKKYRLDWFHETTGSTEGYTQFNTLEEAIETLNIKPIERN